MVAGRHNLTRRALLGVGVGVCVGRDSHLLTVPSAAAVERGDFSPTPARDSRQATVPRWNRSLAAFRRAEARMAAFKAQERLLPEARRAWPACRDLEERFGDLNDLRHAALRRLLRIPSPDIAALALKLELVVADQAWELVDTETCLEAIAADARRLSANSSE
jgi:hypothetical protein